MKHIRRIVVEGCGSWAMEYFKALKAAGRNDIGVLFTYDSTFGLDFQAERLPARLFSAYLQTTLRNVETITKAGFACVDVKDTLFKLRGKPYGGRGRLPKHVEVVFVATPDRTHCDVAEYWLKRAEWIFVEKPFDASAKRIEEFCRQLGAQTYTQVFGVDHYFVRCNQAAVQEHFFLDRLLKTDRKGKPQGDLTAFEFCMTEPPATDGRGKYDPTPMRERALALQGGMVFDMGAHALPVLLPFIDLTQRIQPIEVWAGVSKPLRSVLFSGAESFSIAKVQAHTRRASGKSPRPITGKFIIGKDIGDRPHKYLLLQGPKGGVRFDLTDFDVYHEKSRHEREWIAPLQQNWAQLFVKEVVEGRIPRSVEIFEPHGALQVVKFLEAWRGYCQAGKTKTYHLRDHQPGDEISVLMKNPYQVK